MILQKHALASGGSERREYDWEKDELNDQRHQPMYGSSEAREFGCCAKVCSEFNRSCDADKNANTVTIATALHGTGGNIEMPSQGMLAFSLTCSNRAINPFKISLGAGGQPRMCTSTGTTFETPPMTA
jgi:hypothetical protein